MAAPAAPTLSARTGPVAGNADRVTLGAPKTQISHAELRALAASQHTPRPSAQVNIENLCFGVEIEAEGFNMNAARPTVAGLPEWPAGKGPTGWEVVHDGSLGSGGECVSPVMTLQGGEAKRQITTVVNTIKSLGGQFTSKCGLHVHVDASSLGKEGLARLMRIALENENLMFRMSQNGRPQHRGTIPNEGMRDGVPYTYCKPVSSVVPDPFPLLHAESSGEFRNAYYTAIPNLDMAHPRPALPPPEVDGPFHPARRDTARYLGINFNSYWYRGTIEFRLFDPTGDPEQILADVKLVLGLIKAASEDSYDFLQSGALHPQMRNEPVSREAYDYFMSKTVSDPQTRARLDRTFAQSGGQLVDPPGVKDPSVLSVAALIEAGNRFKSAGKMICSPLEVVNEVRARRRPVACVSADGVEHAVSGEADLGKLDRQLIDRTDVASLNRLQPRIGELEGYGYGFYHTDASHRVDGARLHGGDDILRAMKAGALAVAPASATHEAIAVSDLDQLDRFSVLATAPIADLHPDAHAILTTAERLKRVGVPLGTGASTSGQTTFRPLFSRHAILDAVKNGHAALSLSAGGHHYTSVADAQQLDLATAVLLDDLRALPPHVAKTVDTLSKLEARGVRFVTSTPDGDTLNRLGQVQKLQEGTLRAWLPHPMQVGNQTTSYVSLPTAANLDALSQCLVK